MEDHVGHGIEYFLSVDRMLMSSLYALRDWSHLKIATEDEMIWIRGFNHPEIISTPVLSLPSAKRYYLKDTKLYLLDSRLPSLTEPTLLWTPIQRGLRVNLPKQNFNYFGIEHQHSISLTPSINEENVDVVICDIEILRSYVSTASLVRLERLLWTLYEIDKAIIVGTPVLPIRSKDYYRVDCFLIPAGFKIKYSNMILVYKNVLPESDKYWFIIGEDNNIKKIPRNNFNRLSKGSVERTLSSLK